MIFSFVSKSVFAYKNNLYIKNVKHVQYTVYPYSDTCFENTVESVGVLMSFGTDGQEDILLAHVHLLHNLVAAPSCVLLNRAQQTQQSSGGLCNQLGSRLSVCSLTAELKYSRAPSVLRSTLSTPLPLWGCDPCAPRSHPLSHPLFFSFFFFFLRLLSPSLALCTPDFQERRPF